MSRKCKYINIEKKEHTSKYKITFSVVYSDLTHTEIAKQDHTYYNYKLGINYIYLCYVSIGL